MHNYTQNKNEQSSKHENKTSSDIFAPNYEVFIEELNTYINSHNNEKFCCSIEEIPLSMVNQYFWSYERVEQLNLFKLIVTCNYCNDK